MTNSPHNLRHRWDLSPKEAITLQQELWQHVELTPLPAPPQLLAGVDLSYEIGGKELWAVIVLLDAESLAVVGYSGVRDQMRFPYVPGLLSFREIPALMLAWDQLTRPPDLIFADGHGIAHPRRLGIATHLGLLTGTPTIGCGKSVLVGDFVAPAETRGSLSPMTHQNEVVGYALRTRDRVKPMYISPGHRVALEQAPTLALAATGRYRMPEPTRQAHLLVNRLRRGEAALGMIEED
jgi:deoxyribonuclease V